MIATHESGLAFGQVLAASHALSCAVDGAKSAAWFIEHHLSGSNSMAGNVERIRRDAATLRAIADRLDAAASPPAAITAEEGHTIVPSDESHFQSFAAE